MQAVTIAVSTATILASGLSAQQVPASQVPQSVRVAWQSRFPGAQRAEWKLKSDHAYEAEFRANQVDIAAKFTPAGDWLETETTIGARALPRVVQQAIARDFKRYKLIESQRLDRTAEPHLLWEVHLQEGPRVVKAQFDTAGRVVTKSTKTTPQ